MSLSHGNTTRRILPRWRDSNKVSKNADFVALKPLRRVTVNVEEQFRQQADEFSRSPMIGSAAEVISTALISGKQDAAAEAASFILDHRDEAPNTLLLLARSVTGEPDVFKIQLDTPGKQISKTRQLLRINQDNPVLWSDMARHFASNGDKKQAFRCMKTAQSLAPNHRWILRTVARFLVHHGDANAAHKMLVNHARTRTDPWLIAAELACAQVAGRPPKFWRQATDILRWNTVAPIHLSELATAVAMMELEAGYFCPTPKKVKSSLTD